MDVSPLQARAAELVSEIVRRTEARVEAAIAAAIDVELANLRNGPRRARRGRDVAERVCSGCGDRKPLDSFRPDRKTADGRRSICRACRSRRDRERRRERAKTTADEEPAPAPAASPTTSTRARMVTGGRLRSTTDDDERRRVIEAARANGVEYVERDGRAFQVQRLPSFTHDEQSRTARVEPRRPRGVAIA